MNTKVKAYLYLILTTALWGSMYVVSKPVLAVLPPFTALFLRYVISLMILAPVVAVQIKRKQISAHTDRKDRKYFLIIGILGYFLSIGSQFIGTKYANASVASLINSMNPVTISLFAAVFLKEKLTAARAAAILVAVAGAAVILGGGLGGGQTAGVLFSVLSMVLWSFNSITIRKISGTYSPYMITCVGIAIAALCLIPVSAAELISGPVSPEAFWNVLPALLFMGTACTAIPQFLWNKSLSMVEAGKCSMFYPIQPLVSTLLGVLFLNEEVTFQFLLGAALIIAGILYGVFGERRRKTV